MNNAIPFRAVMDVLVRLESEAAGGEMCIRDSRNPAPKLAVDEIPDAPKEESRRNERSDEVHHVHEPVSYTHLDVYKRQEFCRKNQSDVTLSLPALTQANGVFSEGVLTLATTSAIQYEQLSAPSRLSELERLASDYSGKAVSVQVSAPERLHKTEAELKKEFADVYKRQIPFSLRTLQRFHTISPFCKK